MRVIINPEQQIQRINHLSNLLKRHCLIAQDDLNRKVNEKEWSILEVMKHIAITHKVYRKKIYTALGNSNEQSKSVDQLRCSVIPSYLIKRFPPVKNRIRLKMKTSKQFDPTLNKEQVSSEVIFQELNECLDELKKWVNTYRNESISLKKFNSAIGPVVRFNIPEACEFILCHNERHFFQIDNIISEK